MAEVIMYSKKDKRKMPFSITCTPTKESCVKCPLCRICNKAIKEG